LQLYKNDFAWFCFTISITFIVTLALYFHVPYFNGPYYWQWKYISTSVLRTTIYLIPGILCVLISIIIFKLKKKVYVALAFLLAANFLLQLGCLASSPRGFGMIDEIVKSEAATGYYTDAQKLHENIINYNLGITSWLKVYHSVSKHVHSLNKPPGGILYYYIFISLLGAKLAPIVAGLFLSFLTSLAVPLSFSFARLWTEDCKSQYTCSLLYAIMPGAILFSPEFDQIYPVFTILFLIFWEMSLRKNVGYAAFSALTICIATFFAYNILTIGAFIAIETFILILVRNKLISIKKILTSGLLFTISFMLVQFITFFLTGFDPLVTLKSALENQERLLWSIVRPGGWYIAFDYYDFILASGVAPLGLSLSYISCNLRHMEFTKRQLQMTTCSLLTILVVGLTHLLPGETARVWLFLQPLLLVPAGLSLSSFKSIRAGAVITFVIILLVTMKSRLLFITTQ